jgi:hypothetical protein
MGEEDADGNYETYLEHVKKQLVSSRYFLFL